MNILHVTPAFGAATVYGGPTTYANELARAFCAQGHRMRVLTTNANGPSTLDVECERWIDDSSSAQVYYCRRWAKHSKAPTMLIELPHAISWADCVLVSSVFSSCVVPALSLARLQRKPVALIPHGSLMSYCLARGSRFKQAYLKLALLLAGRGPIVICSSDEEAKAAKAVTGLRVSVVPPFVDVGAAPIREVTSETSRSVSLLFVGRLHPIKAIENVIMALSLVRFTESGLELRLTIAGDGDVLYVRELRALAYKMGIESRVTFLGALPHSEVVQVMRAHDIFILPSHSENFGRVVVEAMGQGLPVIASLGTPWSLLRDRDCGFWIENTPCSLAATFTRLNVTDLIIMGRRARIVAEERFGCATAVQELLNAISSVSPCQS